MVGDRRRGVMSLGFTCVGYLPMCVGMGEIVDIGGGRVRGE